MEFVYVRAVDGAEWEDLVIYLTKEEAIEQSKKYPRIRVEIFRKSERGYVPSYNYYLNGEYVET
jgi:hypothetical protein